MTENTASCKVHFPGQAGKFLRSVLSAGAASKVASRTALLNEAKARGYSLMLFELNDGEIVDLLLFEDGSGFCASGEDGSYTPWPMEFISNDQLHQHEFTPPFENAAAAIDFKTRAGEVCSQLDAAGIDGAEDWFQLIASEMTDPPEALRDFIVSREQPVYWNDRQGQEYAQALIADFAGCYLPAACTLMIYANSDAGRPPVQKENDEHLCKQMDEFDPDFGSRHRRQAMYSGAAYAGVESADGIDYKDLSRFDGALAWFSSRLLERHGQPVGWETDYNDGARDRMSGYSADPEAVTIEIAQPMSNHQRIEALQRIRSYLDEEKLLEAFHNVCDELNLPRLPMFGEGETPA